MTIWERLRTTGLCGRCGALLQAGTPALRYQFVGMQRRLIRCQACAGAPVPDLPPLVVPQQSTTAMQPIRRVITTVTDKWLPYRDAD